ncbi:MAG: hypothetical protein WBC33_06285 [Conexibacter sp.]
MPRRSKLLMLALTSALVLAAPVGAASASRGLQIEPAGLTTATAPLTFVLEPRAGRYSALVTLRSSLHRTIVKTIGALVGTITDCRWSLGTEEISVAVECRLTLPWHIRYDGFMGTLPNITEMRLQILNFSVRVTDLTFGGLLINCLYGGTIRAIASTPLLETIHFSESEGLPTTTPEGPGCELSATTFRQLDTVRLDRRRTLRLI